MAVSLFSCPPSSPKKEKLLPAFIPLVLRPSSRLVQLWLVLATSFFSVHLISGWPLAIDRTRTFLYALILAGDQQVSQLPVPKISWEEGQTLGFPIHRRSSVYECYVSEFQSLNILTRIRPTTLSFFSRRPRANLQNEDCQWESRFRQPWMPFCFFPTLCTLMNSEISSYDTGRKQAHIQIAAGANIMRLWPIYFQTNKAFVLRGVIVTNLTGRRRKGSAWCKFKLLSP